MTRLVDSKAALRVALGICGAAMVADLVWAAVGPPGLVSERLILAIVAAGVGRIVGYRLMDVQLDEQGDLDPYPAGPWWMGSSRWSQRVGVVVGGLGAIGLGVLATTSSREGGLLWLLVAVLATNAFVAAVRLWMLARREARFAASLPAD